MLNKYFVALIVAIIAGGFIAGSLYFVNQLNQRQITAPQAQFADTFSCPIGGIPIGLAGACPSGWSVIPVYPTGGPQGGQLQPTSSSIDGATGASGVGSQTSGIGPTSRLSPSPTPAGGPLGFCCVQETVPTGPSTPTGLFTPTLPIDEPTPTLQSPTPLPTGCGGETILSQEISGCGAPQRCDFSVENTGAGTVQVRSLWSDGIFNSGNGNTIQSDRLNAQTFAYPQPGEYQISLECAGTDGTGVASDETCIKQISILPPNACPSQTPVPPVDTPTPTSIVHPSPTPTGPACRLPLPRINFTCPNGCITPSQTTGQGVQP